MKNTMKFLALALAISCLVCAFSGCSPEQPAELTYQVKVIDALGAPYTEGVVVRFMQGGQQAAMQVVNDQGIAGKTLPAGEYSVELTFTGNAQDYYYDASAIKLTADQTAADVILAYKTTEAVTLYADGEQSDAYALRVGSNSVHLTAGERSYFLFTPTEPGMYEFSITDPTAKLGYYGAPHFVQSESAAEVVDNKFSISVSASMIGTNNTGTTVLVIGVDAGEQAQCLLNVQRTGEPERTLEDEPWTIYEATSQLQAYTLPAGAQLGEFDLTGDYALVYSEADGYYHLNTADGPLVLMRLGEDSQYLASFKNILDRSGVVKYFFDENGEFVKKESYSECLLEYIQYMDADHGVYPLTKDLVYIVQQRGEYSGWFDPNQSLYLFKDVNGNHIPNINPEISWLFMCCYIQG